MYFILIPSEKINLNTTNNIITIEDLLKENYIEYFEVSNNPIELKGILGISQDEFKNILYTLIMKYNIDQLKYAQSTLHYNYIKIKVPNKIFNLIDTQYEVNIFPSVIDNNLHLKLKDLKIGKLKLPNILIEHVLKLNTNKLPFEIEKNEIIIKSSYIEPIYIETIKVNKEKITLNILVTAIDIIEFIGEHNTN